jgi:hypothetical protein
VVALDEEPAAMTQTLGGRIQTRLVLLSSIGLIWTLAITPWLPRTPAISLRLAYRITLETSIAMTILGVLWEFIYHGLQQLRWDKDWPSFFALLAGVAEAIAVWQVLHGLHWLPGETGFSSSILPLYVIHFSTTWLVVWLVTQGPLRVVQLRWRFEGGSFSKRPPDALAPFVVTNFGMAIALVILWFVWS